MYTKKVIDHFQNPRNVGELEDASAIAEAGNPICGDMMRFSIKVKNNRITDIRFKTFGCGAAIASSSILTEMVMGKTLEEAFDMSKDDIVDALGGLPPHKVHCSILGIDALRHAICDYWRKQGEIDKHPECKKLFVEFKDKPEK